MKEIGESIKKNRAMKTDMRDIGLIMELEITNQGDITQDTDLVGMIEIITPGVEEVDLGHEALLEREPEIEVMTGCEILQETEPQVEAVTGCVMFQETEPEAEAVTDCVKFLETRSEIGVVISYKMFQKTDPEVEVVIGFEKCQVIGPEAEAMIDRSVLLEETELEIIRVSILLHQVES